jgi:hypothetical protein
MCPAGSSRRSAGVLTCADAHGFRQSGRAAPGSGTLCRNKHRRRGTGGLADCSSSGRTWLGQVLQRTANPARNSSAANGRFGIAFFLNPKAAFYGSRITLTRLFYNSCCHISGCISAGPPRPLDTCHCPAGRLAPRSSRQFVPWLPVKNTAGMCGSAQVP